MEWAARLKLKSDSFSVGKLPHVGLVPEPEPGLPKPLSGLAKLPFALRETKGSCDLFSGKWVWDNVTHPLYKEDECPFIDSQLSCHANGRPDNSYQFWRWQPDGCDLPSFNATLVLESIRGKKMLFVGDSLNRAQFYSIVCLVQSLVPETERSLEQHDSFITFQAKSYTASIQYYWAPFLLESNQDNTLTHKSADRTVRIGSIEKHGEHWKGGYNDFQHVCMVAVELKSPVSKVAHVKNSKSNIEFKEGTFEEEPQHIAKYSTEEAYGLAIKSMIKWVKKNMDTKKTRVFFSSMSPMHTMSAEWGGKEGGNCYNETKIIADKTYWGSNCRKSMMQVIQDEFTKSEYPITLLNITQLSSYRKDAHLSIYKKHWVPLMPEQVANPSSYADCLHFCLPGLQDTWNELLFAKLFYP
ncbi:unnamed protein product [Rhodiola kirilowii]